MYEEEVHSKVLVIIERNVRLASLIEKEPRMLQLLNVAASQSSVQVKNNRWETYESFKKTYLYILQSSNLKSDALLHEYHEAFVTIYYLYLAFVKACSWSLLNLYTMSMGKSFKPKPSISTYSLIRSMCDYRQ